MSASMTTMESILAALDDDQQATLLFIDQYQRLNWGLPPTYAEIGREFGICKMSARGRIKTLERRGFLRTVPHTKRSITWTLRGRAAITDALGISEQSQPRPGTHGSGHSGGCFFRSSTLR